MRTAALTFRLPGLRGISGTPESFVLSTNLRAVALEKDGSNAAEPGGNKNAKQPLGGFLERSMRGSFGGLTPAIALVIALSGSSIASAQSVMKQCGEQW